MNKVDLSKKMTATAVAAALMSMAGFASAAIEGSPVLTDATQSAADKDGVVTIVQNKDKTDFKVQADAGITVTEGTSLVIGNATSGKVQLKAKDVNQVLHAQANKDKPSKITVSADKLDMEMSIKAEKGTSINLFSNQKLGYYGNVVADGGSIRFDSETGFSNSKLDFTQKPVVAKPFKQLEVTNGGKVEIGHLSMGRFDTVKVDNGGVLTLVASALPAASGIEPRHPSFGGGSSGNVWFNSMVIGGDGSVGTVHMDLGGAEGVFKLRDGGEIDVKGAGSTLSLKGLALHGTVNAAAGTTVKYDNVFAGKDDAGNLVANNLNANGAKVIAKGGNVTNLKATGSSTVALSGKVNVTNLDMADSSLDLNGATIDKLTGNNINVTVHTNLNTSIADSTGANGMKIFATSQATNEYNGNVNALLQNMGYTEQTKAKADVTMAGSDIIGEITMKDGKVTEKVHQGNLAMGEMIAATPALVARVQLNDLRKRLGDVRANENASGVWARYNGGAFSGDNGLDADFNMIQIGADHQFKEGQPRFGVALSFAQTEADTTGSSADTDTLSVAGYASWMNNEGLFADTIVRFGVASSEVNVGAATGDLDSFSFGASGEVGYRFNLAEQFFVEPSAELTYGYLASDSFLVGAVKHTLEATESLQARVGVASGMELPNNLGSVYVRVAGVHEFLGESDYKSQSGFASRTITFGEDETWFEYAVGGSINFNPNTYMYLDLERTEGANVEEDWRANVGVRYSF